MEKLLSAVVFEISQLRSCLLSRSPDPLACPARYSVGITQQGQARLFGPHNTQLLGHTAHTFWAQNTQLFPACRRTLAEACGGTLRPGGARASRGARSSHHGLKHTAAAPGHGWEGTCSAASCLLLQARLRHRGIFPESY